MAEKFHVLPWRISKCSAAVQVPATFIIFFSEIIHPSSHIIGFTISNENIHKKQPLNVEQNYIFWHWLVCSCMEFQAKLMCLKILSKTRQHIYSRGKEVGFVSPDLFHQHTSLNPCLYVVFAQTPLSGSSLALVPFWVDALQQRHKNMETI